jgi:hypothetical protein
VARRYVAHLESVLVPPFTQEPRQLRERLLYDSTFSRTVWRMYGGAKGLVMWYYQLRERLAPLRRCRLVEPAVRCDSEGPECWTVCRLDRDRPACPLGGAGVVSTEQQEVGQPPGVVIVAACPQPSASAGRRAPLRAHPRGGWRRTLGWHGPRTGRAAPRSADHPSHRASSLVDGGAIRLNSQG